MAVQSSPADLASPPIPVVVVAGAPGVRRFTVDEYHRMIETGILGENDRVELVNGWIVEMSPIGPPHSTCVRLVSEVLRHVLPKGWFVVVQDPITLPTSEPQPDVVVVRGHLRDYSTHHPSGSDIGLVIEVADSSLLFDRIQKKPQYAAAGIPEYWIVNLIERRLEVYRNPKGNDYSSREIIPADGQVELILAGKTVGSFAVADLLP